MGSELKTPQAKQRATRTAARKAMGLVLRVGNARGQGILLLTSAACARACWWLRWHKRDEAGISVHQSDATL